MMFFSRNKPASAATPPVNGVMRETGRPAANGDKAMPSPNCALWHDITRALDMKQGKAK